IQSAIRGNYAVTDAGASVHFQVCIEEELLMDIDGAHPTQESTSAENRGVRVTKARDAGATVKVTVLPKEKDLKPRSMEIPLSILEFLITEQLAASDTAVQPEELISRAVNRAVTNVMIAAADRPLHEAVVAGAQDAVQSLIERATALDE